MLFLGELAELTVCRSQAVCLFDRVYGVSVNQANVKTVLPPSECCQLSFTDRGMLVYIYHSMLLCDEQRFSLGLFILLFFYTLIISIIIMPKLLTEIILCSGFFVFYKLNDRPTDAIWFISLKMF